MRKWMRDLVFLVKGLFSIYCIAYLEVLEYDVGVEGAGGGAGGGGGRGGGLLVDEHPHRVADPPPVASAV